MLAALALALKAALTASVVVAATVIAERSRPMLAAIVMALPVSAGPAYVLLSFQHDPAFLAGSSQVGLLLNAATTALVVVYGALVRRGVGLVPALSAGYIAWLVVLLATLAVPVWSLPVLVAVQMAAMLLGIFITRQWRGPPVRSSIRKWYDLPMRAALVVSLTLTTVILSVIIGPIATGVLAGLPVTFTSFMIVMHLRVGGPATANLMASALMMLPGFTLGLLAFHLCAGRGEIPLGLVVFFVVPVIYALGLLASTRMLRRRPA